MTPVHDIKGELAALREKELELRARHAEQLVRLLQETRADELDPALLAGLLLEGVEEQDAGKREGWRRRGEAMFRPSRPRRRKEAGATPPAPDGAGQAAASPAAA